MTASVTKYLARHSEPELNHLASFPEQRWRHLLVLPCYDETIDCIERLKDHPETDFLTIAVINQPDTEPTPTPQNRLLYDCLINNGETVWQSGNLALTHLSENNCPDNKHLLLVDRFTQGRQIPARQGVGLARKIGADLGAWLIHHQRIDSSMIHTTDADAILPDNYFAQPRPYLKNDSLRNDGRADDSAYLYPWQHRTDTGSAVDRATAVYEQSLQHYQEGLAWAGSPYAFSTIGSCMAISALHYCQARGFPKRSGGEDFYLLNKLAKLGRVIQSDDAPIIIQPRLSHRVPFGTGPAVEKILALDDPAHYTSYHPAIFTHLKTLLTAFEHLSQLDSRAQITDWLNELDANSRRALEQLQIESLFKHLLTQVRGQSGDKKRRHSHHWFDAFKTLKYVHCLREQGLPNMPVNEARRQLRQLIETAS